MSHAFIRRKPEFGDLLFFTYILVFARQWFWSVDSNVVAWFLALVVSTLLWLAYLYTRPAEDKRTPRLFWLTVALPLVFIFSLRVALPDTAYDVLNHRLVQAERSLRGPQLLPGDFFPTIFPFNPLSDMLTGIFRHLFGYRLGTIVNLLALVWSGVLLEKILRPFVKASTWRCFAILLILFTEHALFQINSYMVDLLALPFILEATRLALRSDQPETQNRDLILSALFLGVAVALKLTNAAMVIPILAVVGIRILTSKRQANLLQFVPLAAFAFIFPWLVHALYIYNETGNPFFPLYNNLIGSRLWPAMTPYDGRWGPENLQQTLLWPLLSIVKQSRLSELGVYSGRLAAGLIAAALCLLLPRVDIRARLMGLIVLFASLLWSFTSGYARYALFAEIIGGVLLVYLVGYILIQADGRSRPVKYALASLPLILLTAQVSYAGYFLGQTEWSRRPTVFEAPGAHAVERRWIWRDRNLMDFQSSESKDLFRQVDVWIVSAVKSNGVEILLRPDVPMLAVDSLQYFDRRESRRRFEQALGNLQGKRLFSLSLTDELDAALNALKRRHLIAREVTPVIVPFFSRRTTFHMSLIEIELPAKVEPPARPTPTNEITKIGRPLDDDAFIAGLDAVGVPSSLRPGERTEIRVRVKNLSNLIWPAGTQTNWQYLITVSNVWRETDGALVNNVDGKSGLPHDLWPREEVSVPVMITAPNQPGEYILEVDMVQEGVAWFKDKDSEIWRGRIRVE